MVPDARDEVAGPVAELVHGGAMRQFLVGQDLDAIGVDDDVLGAPRKATTIAQNANSAEVIGGIACSPAATTAANSSAWIGTAMHAAGRKAG